MAKCIVVHSHLENMEHKPTHTNPEIVGSIYTLDGFDMGGHFVCMQWRNQFKYTGLAAVLHGQMGIMY